MILFKQDYLWTPEDSQTDVKFSFVCPDTVKELWFHLQYAPGKEEERNICIPMIRRALRRYYDAYPSSLQPMQPERFLPIKNLVTLSLDYQGEYLGNAHRWDTDQHHRITLNHADRGFVPPKQLAGQWGGMIHLHEIVSKQCTGCLTIEGREMES